jgi:hypothetical protein
MPVSDRAKAGLAAFIRSVVGNLIIGANVDRLALYPAKVATQNADGTLELQPDDSRLPPYSNVPIRYGVPGVTATVPNGARALLTWAGGDPQKPIVVGWEPGTVLTIVLAGGSAGVGRVGDAVKVTIPVNALTLAVSGATATGPAAPLDVTGTITAGSAKVKAG